MDKKTKTKIIIFGIIAILIILIIIIVVSVINKKNNSEEQTTSVLTTNSKEDEQFTVKDMIVVNDESEKTSYEAGSSVLSKRTNEYSSLISNDDSDISTTKYKYEEESKEMKLLQKVLREQNSNKQSSSYNLPSEKKTDPVPVSPVINKEEEKETVTLASGKRIRNKSTNDIISKDFITACIHGDQVIYNGSTVKMRLLESLQVGNVIIPKNTLFYGVAVVGKSRININIPSIKYDNSIQNVNVDIYDNDGIKGLNLPNNIKEMLAKQSTEKGVNEIPSVKSGVIGDVVNATTGVVKSVVGNNINDIKVTLKSNYNIFLK